MYEAIPYGPRHSQAQIWKGSCTVLRGLGFDKVDFNFFFILCFVHLLLRLILTRRIYSFFSKSFVFCALVAQINSDSLHRGIFSQCLTKSLAALTRFSYHIHALSYTLVEKFLGSKARPGPFRSFTFANLAARGQNGRVCRASRRGMVPS